MRNEERTSKIEEGENAIDASASHNLDNAVKEDIDKLAAFLYHLYGGKQG